MLCLQDPPEDSVVTMCGHVFCYQCVSDYLNGDGNTCSAPGCKAALAKDGVFSKATLRSCLSDELGGSNSIKVHDFARSLAAE
ncbi:helicase-like transcription factor CHR28 [Arachis ipaensis]|uniref:helicase-like transcription factor CHR28 n=1 Tax=Arachis ipaensis TaxID=130454 RepID=UPI000A2B60FA|nr:helicase-like transcription factor CHR28 [Arachis ipaensis]